jgi:hypothetical protein
VGLINDAKNFVFGELRKKKNKMREMVSKPDYIYTYLRWGDIHHFPGDSLDPLNYKLQCELGLERHRVMFNKIKKLLNIDYYPFPPELKEQVFDLFKEETKKDKYLCAFIQINSEHYIILNNEVKKYEFFMQALNAFHVYMGRPDEYAPFKFS